MPAASELPRRRRLTTLVVGVAIVVLVGGWLAIGAASTVMTTADAGARLDATLAEATEVVADAEARFAELRGTRDTAR